jgi:hypothetical protein
LKINDPEAVKFDSPFTVKDAWKGNLRFVPTKRLGLVEFESNEAEFKKLT